VYVHLMGLAIVRLEWSMKARIWSRKSSSEVKLPRLSSLRTRILSQIST
jgi:hypothetical protein